MESLRELYRTGAGPSSSHTMGPQRAALIFRARFPQAAGYRVSLYGSLAATGRGHLTDAALERALSPLPVEIQFHPKTILPFHPNGMDLDALDARGVLLGTWRVFSVGGGALREEGAAEPPRIYAQRSMEQILAWCDQRGAPMWRLVEESEGSGIWEYLGAAWGTMKEAIARGLQADGILPGALQLQRRAKQMYGSASPLSGLARSTGLLSAYALAVMEENASTGIVVTAPTCGACGVVPGTLKYFEEANGLCEQDILRALATAGLIGNLVKTNASISGAEVGCQGEVGTACAMAAGAAAQLLGGTPRQVEYAAEMGMEHHLGLTCDPVMGLVQIPCIERNAFAATRAASAAEFALLSDGKHRISFDQVIETMKQTGKALPSAFRETSEGGLANLYRQASHPM